MVSYTKEALEAVNKDKLYELAQYYNLDVTWRMLKGDIIDVIIEHFNKTIVEPDKEEELPPMSVRVRRIYESNKEK